MVRMYRSASGTCSPLATVLTVTPNPARSPVIPSNWPSISTVCRTNPLFLYILHTSLVAFTRDSCFWSAMRTAVPNLMCREMVTKNGSLLTYMMSAPMITWRYCDIMMDGTGVAATSTCSVCLRTVFPFRDPTSGPNILSAFRMSSRVTGQLGMRLSPTIFMNSADVGRPINFWTFRARTARPYARFV